VKKSLKTRFYCLDKGVHLNEELIDLALSNLETVGIDISNREIDHLAYRCTSNGEFRKIREQMLTNYGNLLAENIIRNRPIPIFKLVDPIQYRGYEVPCLEIMAPAEGDREYKRKLEHLEIVIDDMPLVKFASQYPNIKFNTENLSNKNNPELVLTFSNDANVKFHPIPIEKVIKQVKSSYPLS